MKPTYQGVIDALYSLVPSMWCINLGIDLVQKPRNWWYIAFDVVMIVFFEWAVRQSERMKKEWE
jgi:hypothetical protein